MTKVQRVALSLLLLGATAAIGAGQGPTVLLRIPFVVDSDQLGPLATARLEKALPVLKADYTGLRIEIAGHTDNLENDAYNIDLSRRRAKAVYDWLAAQGVDMRLYSQEAYGKAQPIADNATREGRFRNRRVELRLLDDAAPGDFTNP